MQTLRSAQNQYPLLLELRALDGVDNPLDHVRKVFDGLEALPSAEPEA